jgi:hypothetical protein
MALVTPGLLSFLELDVGTFVSRPEGSSRASTYANGLVGLRVVLDVPGK